MKLRYKYALTFTVIHLIVTICAMLLLGSNSYNLIAFPNIAVFYSLTAYFIVLFPFILQPWSIVVFGGFFWFVAGFVIGCLLEKNKS